MSESGWEQTRRTLREARDVLLMQTNITVTCGKCGSEHVYFSPTTDTCFGCGAMYHLLPEHIAEDASDESL